MLMVAGFLWHEVSFPLMPFLFIFIQSLFPDFCTALCLVLDETSRSCTTIRFGRNPLTFLVQTLLLVEDDELAVLVCLLQDVLALLDVAVVVFQPEEGRHQGHVGL